MLMHGVVDMMTCFCSVLNGIEETVEIILASAKKRKKPGASFIVQKYYKESSLSD